MLNVGAEAEREAVRIVIRTELAEAEAELIQKK
jgi:hypothetical protein